VKARSTTTSDGDCQASLCLFERRERHGLGGSNAEPTDANRNSQSEKLCHSALPKFVKQRKVFTNQPISQN
jgi:hypothetical protein